MRGGVILIVIALIVGYMGVTGKYKCFTSMLGCLVGDSSCECKGASGAGGGATGSWAGIFPPVAPLRPIPPLTPGIAG